MWSGIPSSCTGWGVATALRVATLCLLSCTVYCGSPEAKAKSFGAFGEKALLAMEEAAKEATSSAGKSTLEQALEIATTATTPTLLASAGRDHVLLRREGEAEAGAHGALVDEDAPGVLGTSAGHMRRQSTVDRAARYVEIGPHATVSTRDAVHQDSAEKAANVLKKAEKAKKEDQHPELEEQQRVTSIDIGDNLKAVLGDQDTNKCPDGATHIVDPDLCRQAAGNLSYEWSSNSLETDASYPTGCYGNNKVAWFNEDTGGHAELLSRPICVMEGDGSTTSSTQGNSNATVSGSGSDGSTKSGSGSASSQADYTFDHAGHCAAGWDGAAHREATIGACFDRCKSSTTCGYFAYDDVSTSGDNCALYDVAGGCVDDGQFLTFNAYRMAAQADYTWDHDGHCAAGWTKDSSREDTISSCASKCRGNSICGYFAYDGETATGDNCALFDVDGGCPDDDLYPKYNAYRMVSQADYTFDHDGHCGTGLLDSTREATISSCASQCRSNDDCGYFAWNAGDTTDAKNCAIYTRSGECTDDHQYPEFNAYRMVKQASSSSFSGSRGATSSSSSGSSSSGSSSSSNSNGPKCISFNCPLGFHWKKGANDISCDGYYDGDACQADVDTKNCCDETYAGVLTEVYYIPTNGHLPDLTGHTPDVKRVDVQVNFPGDDSAAASRSTVFRFTGQLRITNQGMYSFRLTSKDGSRLTLDGSNTLTIDDDGIHDQVKTAVGGETLRSGMHPFQIDYFTVSGIHIVWEYSGPDTAGLWDVVPQDVLYEPPAFCCSMECPDGKQLVDDSTKVTCLAKPCDPHMDEARCCESSNSFHNMLNHAYHNNNSGQNAGTCASPSALVMLMATVMMMWKLSLRE